MTVRRMVVTLVVESDAYVRDLVERGFWDHLKSPHLRILDIEAHAVPKRGTTPAPLAALVSA